MIVGVMADQYQLRRIGKPATCAGVLNVMRLKAGLITFGRSMQCDYFINSSKLTCFISRKHTEIQCVVNATGEYTPLFILIDCSLNGTYVNDRRVKDRVTLKEGDMVTFGHKNGKNIAPGIYARQPDSEFMFLFERTGNKSSENKDRLSSPRLPVAVCHETVNQLRRLPVHGRENSVSSTRFPPVSKERLSMISDTSTTAGNVNSATLSTQSSLAQSVKSSSSHSSNGEGEELEEMADSRKESDLYIELSCSEDSSSSSACENTCSLSLDMSCRSSPPTVHGPIAEDVKSIQTKGEKMNTVIKGRIVTPVSVASTLSENLVTTIDCLPALTKVCASVGSAQTQVNRVSSSCVGKSSNPGSLDTACVILHTSSVIKNTAIVRNISPVSEVASSKLPLTPPDISKSSFVQTNQCSNSSDKLPDVQKNTKVDIDCSFSSDDDDDADPPSPIIPMTARNGETPYKFPFAPIFGRKILASPNPSSDKSLLVSPTTAHISSAEGTDDEDQEILQAAASVSRKLEALHSDEDGNKILQAAASVSRKLEALHSDEDSNKVLQDAASVSRKLEALHSDEESSSSGASTGGTLAVPLDSTDHSNTMDSTKIQLKGINTKRKRKGSLPSRKKSSLDGNDDHDENGLPYYEIEKCSSIECKRPISKKIEWVQCDDCDEWYHTVCVGCNYTRVKKDETEFHCGCN